MEVEEVVSDRNDDKKENMIRIKRQNARMELLLMRWRKVSVIKMMTRMKKLMMKKR